MSEVVIDTTRPEDGEYNADLLSTIRDLGLHPIVIPYVDAPHNAELIQEADAVVVSGVPLHYPSETAEQLQPLLGPILHGLVEHKTPTLTICLAHQVLGLTFGAILQRNVEVENGIVTVKPAEGQEANPLLAGLGDTFSALSSHWASIDTTQSSELIRIASSIRDEPTSTGCMDEAVQVVGAPVYGVQFHPEKIEGEKSNDGKQILRNFFRIARLID